MWRILCDVLAAKIKISCSDKEGDQNAKTCLRTG